MIKSIFQGVNHCNQTAVILSNLKEKNFKGSRKDWQWVSINFKDQTSAEEIEIYDDNSEEEYHCSNANNIVSSPLKLRGGSCFWNLDREGGHEKTSQK